MATEHIPREFIQQLLSRVDIVDLIDARIPLHKKSGNNYFACCPFHNEKSPSFSVSQHKQFYYCFGCGAHGNAIDFFMQYDRFSFPEAIEALAKHVGMEVPYEHTSAFKPPVNVDLYELLAHITQFYQSELKQSAAAIDYLKKRGLSGAIAKAFSIGYAPSGWDHVLQQFGKSTLQKQQLTDAGMLIKKEEGGYYDRFRERIMFPIHDRQGRVIGFGGRILNKGEPKYLNSPETSIFQKGHELYGLYETLKENRKLQRVVIVEGYMDVLALFQHGINYAVATLGTATSAFHLQRLFRYTSEVIFCFDGDEAGRTAAWRALLVILPIMRDDVQVHFMFLPNGEDPDSFIRKEGKENFEQHILAAIPLSQYFFKTLGAEANLGTTDGRARFVKLATEHLQVLPPGIFQKMMLDELAKKARINTAQLAPPASTSKNTRLKTQKPRRPSALRLAVTLLVQQPELANAIPSPLPPLESAGFPLFSQLVEKIRENSIKTTGELLECFRESRESALLVQFARIPHMIPLSGIENEFLGAILRLQKLAQKQIIEKLLAKAALNELTPEQKQNLHELIHNK